MTPTSYVVTLIHGTFASKAAWVKRGSPLCMSLAQSLEVPIIGSPLFQVGSRMSILPAIR